MSFHAFPFLRRTIFCTSARIRSLCLRLRIFSVLSATLLARIISLSCKRWSGFIGIEGERILGILSHSTICIHRDYRPWFRPAGDNFDVLLREVKKDHGILRMFTKALGVNNQRIPGVNVVYTDASSRVRALHSKVLKADRLSHLKKPCTTCTDTLGLRPPTKSIDPVRLHRLRHAGGVPKKIGLRKA